MWADGVSLFWIGGPFHSLAGSKACRVTGVQTCRHHGWGPVVNGKPQPPVHTSAEWVTGRSRALAELIKRNVRRMDFLCQYKEPGSFSNPPVNPGGGQSTKRAQGQQWNALSLHLICKIKHGLHYLLKNSCFLFISQIASNKCRLYTCHLCELNFRTNTLTLLQSKFITAVFRY